MNNFKTLNQLSKGFNNQTVRELFEMTYTSLVLRMKAEGFTTKEANENTFNFLITKGNFELLTK